jgi:hypothetical protein
VRTTLRLVPFCSCPGACFRPHFFHQNSHDTSKSQSKRGRAKMETPFLPPHATQCLVSVHAHAQHTAHDTHVSPRARLRNEGEERGAKDAIGSSRWVPRTNLAMRHEADGGLVRPPHHAKAAYWVNVHATPEARRPQHTRGKRGNGSPWSIRYSCPACRRRSCWEVPTFADTHTHTCIGL